ncbi:MAG: FGGY-family carbohydrate kinase [Christensenellaceae bacterium]|nr:FGGY-family carbohydrate kinase [Christensenellaceae bacterium]MEA5065951.1 FGGY-family carbohydrate kinase [Eubacteriales bacterium]MEA5068010.1 FGGY-family carbohydrate kinase [Christensenellaceae bacterium]
MLVLALESSTSSAKALLYDSGKGVIATESSPYDPSYAKDGVVGTEEVFRLTAEMGRRIAAGKDIAAIALSSVWHSVALCDRDMRPAGGTYMWNYLAPSDMCKTVRADAALTERLYRSTGCMPNVTYPRHALRYLRENGVELADKLLPSQGGYNFHRLTGEFRETINIMNGSGFLNVHTLAYDDFAMGYSGVRASQLGALSTYLDTAPLREDAANLIGIPAGIPVVPSHADGALNQIASCAAVVGRMTLSVGTSGAIRLTTDRPVLPEGKQIWSYYGVADYMSGAAISGACNCIDWFRDTFSGSRMSFEELDSGAEIPEGMPVFLPFLFGERNPGWRDDRHGGFGGIRPSHTARDMYRALQAGVLFNLYQCYEVLRSEVGEPREIYASGGILHSRRWTQMMADIFGTRIRLVKNLNASSVGAAVLAMRAVCAIDDIRAFSRDIEGAAVICPRPEFQRSYAEYYQRYLELYNATALL